MKSKYIAFVALRHQCSETRYIAAFKAAVPHATYIDFFCENERKGDKRKVGFDIFKESIGEINARVAPNAALFIPLLDAANIDSISQLQVTAFLKALDKQGYNLLVFVTDTKSFLQTYDMLPKRVKNKVTGNDRFKTEQEFRSYMQRFEQRALANDPEHSRKAIPTGPSVVTFSKEILHSKSIFSQQRTLPFAKQSHNEALDLIVFIVLCTMMWFALRCNTRNKKKFKKF